MFFTWKYALPRPAHLEKMAWISVPEFEFAQNSSPLVCCLSKVFVQEKMAVSRNSKFQKDGSEAKAASKCPPEILPPKLSWQQINTEENIEVLQLFTKSWESPISCICLIHCECVVILHQNWGFDLDQNINPEMFTTCFFLYQFSRALVSRKPDWGTSVRSHQGGENFSAEDGGFVMLSSWSCLKLPVFLWIWRPRV